MPPLAHHKRLIRQGTMGWLKPKLGTARAHAMASWTGPLRPGYNGGIVEKHVPMIVVFAVLASGCAVHETSFSASPWATSFQLRHWPAVQPGVTTHTISSYDRSGGNDDGFTGAFSELYVDRRGEHVIFDTSGPGALTTLWFTSDAGGNAPLGLGKVRFYFDDDQDARIVVDADELFAGKTKPFVEPLVANNRRSTGGFVSWVPLPFARRLRVTTERKAGFYACQYTSVPADWPVRSWQPGQIDGDLVTLFRDATGPSATPMTRIDLPHTETGPSVIEVLRFVAAEPPTPELLENARVRIWFDAAAEPQIDAPFGAFFGSFLRARRVASVAFFADASTFENRLPMPFTRSARIEIEGIQGAAFIHVRALRPTEQDWGTLETRLRDSDPSPPPGKDHVFADEPGAGKLVATVLTVRPKLPEDKQWWEGDTRTWIDGSRTPVAQGTGHEDDHFGGWSNEFFGTPFSLPMAGEPASQMTESKGVQYNAWVSLYRLFPSMNFTSGIRHAIEHGPRDDRVARYTTLAFLYSTPGALVESDRLDLANAASRAEHAYVAAGEGPPWRRANRFEPGGEDVEIATFAHQGIARFRMRLAPHSRGAVLRVVCSRGGARIARIRFNGTLTVEVRSHDRNVNASWMEQDVFVPEPWTRDENLTIEVIPDGGWSPSSYRLLGFVR
jgi:hypothetical protein